MNAEETNTNKEASSENSIEDPDQLAGKTAIPDTPFWAIKHNEKYLVTFGQYKLHDKPFDTLPELFEYLEKCPFNVVFRLIAAMLEKYDELKKEDSRYPTEE